MVAINCNLCGDNSYVPLFQKNGYNIVQCSSCALAYVNPQPDKQDLNNYYQKYPHDLYISSPKKIKSKLIDAKRELTRLKRLHNLQAPSLLDVGCSYGFVLKIAKDAKWNAVGIDLSAEAVDYAKNQFHVDTRVGDLLSFNTKPCAFDFITIYDAIEHCLDPLANIRKAFELLKDNGFLIISTPDFGHRIAKKQGVNWGALNPPGHLFFYTFDTIKKLGERADLKYYGHYLRFPHRATLKLIFIKSIGCGSFVTT